MWRCFGSLGAHGRFGFEGERIELELEIDVTDLSAEEAAARILDNV